MLSDATLSAGILLCALFLFVSNRVRHDLVALLALFACLVAGLVAPAEALAGFSDPAVLTVAAILVVGRAVELSGVAAWITRSAVPEQAEFVVRLAILLISAAFLSAFVNNIAALVITMPVAAQIARGAHMPPAATLMPLAFATILGGMTTLIGTPANLILSSVRQAELGAPFGFFAMTPVGLAVAAAGLVYLVLLGWRLLPIRLSAEEQSRPPWRVYELIVPEEMDGKPVEELVPRLRSASARLVALFRKDERWETPGDMTLRAGDRLLVMSRDNQWKTAEETGLRSAAQVAKGSDAVTAHAVVAHGSFLIGLGHDAVRARSEGRLAVVAAGPRAAREKIPLERRKIEAGDQLFVRGAPDDLGRFITAARLLEIDRIDPAPVAKARAALIVGVFVAAIAAVVLGGIPPAIAFLAAAVIMAGARLLAAEEIYRSIDWSVIVLLAAMIPVGQSFETSGAADIAASYLGSTLSGMPLATVLGTICALTLLLSIFLNNIATAVIMGPLAIDAANLLGVSPDAALLAVLIGASADFLTPIGHQNNLLVMGPGGYRFTDYARMGGIMVLIVVSVAAMILSISFG